MKKIYALAISDVKITARKGRSADFESVRPHSGIDCACEYFHWNNQSDAILLSASCFSYKPCEPRHHYRFRSQI